MELRLAASGPVPPAVAWERYARTELWPTWSPQIVRVEPAGARLATGLAGRVFGPLGVHVDFVVEAVGERDWAWTVRRGPLSVHLAHGVGPHGSGSRTWLVLTGPAPLVAGYVPLAKWALHRLVTRPA